jgi:inosine-uridine nucleoside N-ribohydrolase
MNKELVFLDHHGGIDDLLSLLLILTMKEKELIGINVTPADCFIEPALESTYKILQFFHQEKIPIGRGDFYGINAFPNEWPYEISNLAGQFWAMTIDTIPSYHYVYFMWDVLATSYLDIPEEFTVEAVRAKVSNRPPNAGQTYLDEEGYKVTIATEMNKEVFYEYILERFKQ